MSNAHGVELIGPTSKLQHKVKKHDDTNLVSKIHPFELCDKKTKRTNKNVVYNYNQIKDKNEMQSCNEQDKAKCELLRHEENKTKQMETNNKSIKKTISRLHPPLVLLHRKKKNRKKKSHKTVVLYKNPSRVKISTEKVIINCDSSKQIREINKSNRGDDKLITRINNLVQGNKPNNQSKIRDENNVTLENNCGNNIQIFKDKHKKRDRGLICKNSIARVESKHKKKRPILNQQLLNEIVKVASTVDPTLLPNDILDQMKSQPIKHDNKHSALTNPSQMAKILKYLNNPTKYKAAHYDTLVNMLKTKSYLFGDKKNYNNPSTDAESQAILEKHKISEKLPQSAFTQKRDKIKQQNNLPVTENLPHNDYKNNKKRERRKKHHGEVEKRNNDYGVGTSKCLKGLQTMDRDYKSNCIKNDSSGASNLNIADNSKLEGVKFNSVTGQKPKLSIVSKAITVKPNKKDGTNVESSNLTASSLVKSYVDQSKREESIQFKQVRKKYKTLYTNKRQTEPSFSNDNKNIPFLKCNENSILEGTKESKKQDTIIEIPKLNRKAGGECCDLPPKKDPQKLLFARRESSNNFLSKKKNHLNTINSSQCINKNRFNTVCSIKDLYQNGRNEQNRTDQMNSSNFNNSQEYSKNCIHVESMEDNLKKNRDKFVIVLPMDSNDVVDKNCMAKDGVLSQNKIVEGNSCKSSFMLENKCHVSEIGVQTDSPKDKNVDFGNLLSREDVEAIGKEGGIGILRYSTNINESLFCKSDDNAESPFCRKSFVHIITDQHEIGENNCCMESNPISSEGGIHSENNCDLPNNNTTENKTELNPDMFNESNQTHNHLIYKINAIYEYLQYFDKLLRNKAFVSCYGSCESMNTIGQFNNILHGLCTNCVEVLNKIGSDPLSEQCKNQNKSTDKSFFQSLENIASNTRHKFLNIIENDPLKSETEKQLTPQLSKNMTSGDIFLNKTLFPKTMSKIQIDSKDNIAKLAHYASPYLDLSHGFDIKTEPDLTKRNSAAKLYKSKIPIEIVQTVPRNDLQSTIISDKKLPFVNKIDMFISEKIQSNLDDIQGKRQPFVNSISECSSTNKTRTNQYPDEKTNRHWLGPVTPPTEKRQLFVNIVQEDCGNKIENNQEIQFSTETKDLKLDGFCPIVTKQNTRPNYCKVDHKPFVVIVPSNHSNLGDRIEYQSTHKNENYFNTGSELKIVTSNSYIREDYFDSLLLERKKKNSDAQDIWWKDKCGSSKCNTRKITEGWGESSSCKMMNELNNKQKSCTDKKYNKYYTSEGNEKHLSDKKFIRSKGHLSLGKKFLKCIRSKSACHLTRVKSTECNHSDTERRNEVVCKSIRFNSSSLTQSTESREISECCFCYDNEIKSVCGVHKIMCSQKSNVDKYNFEQYSNPRKINHNKNHLVYCDPKKKLEYKIKRPEQPSYIDENKNCNENQMYVPAFMLMKNNAKVIDKFLGTQLLDQDTSSSNEFLNFPQDKIKDITLSLKKGYPDIDTNSLNDLQNEFLADNNNLYNNKINKFQASEECNKCKNKTTHSPLLSNITGEIKYLDSENERFLFEESDLTNTILHKTENSKFVSESSFGSDFNRELLKQSLTFTNNKPLLENKAIKEDRKIFNKEKSVSSINFLNKTALYTNPHKIPSIESPIVYSTKSKTKEIKKYKNALNSKLPFNVKEEESKSSLGSLDSQNNKLKIFFNKNISPVEEAQFEGDENTKVKNEVDGTDKWISLNKCDFQNTDLSTTEIADTKDKTIGFKMNIKVSDMHIQFSCQSPDLTLENKIIN